MYNKVILVGNLTRDVELKYLQNGSAVAKIGLATSRKFKKQDGSQGEEVCFVDINLFGRTAEIANQYLRKGSKILIEGRLVLEQWKDQNGTNRSKHTVTAENMTMLGGNDSNQNNNHHNHSSDNEYQRGSQNNQNASYGNKKQQDQIPEIDIDENELPF